MAEKEITVELKADLTQPIRRLKQIKQLADELRAMQARASAAESLLISILREDEGAQETRTTSAASQRPSKLPPPSWNTAVMRRVERTYSATTKPLTDAPVDNAVDPGNADKALATRRTESAMQCLRKRIDLVAIAACRERQDLSAEVIEPGGLGAVIEPIPPQSAASGRSSAWPCRPPDRQRWRKCPRALSPE